MLVRVQNLAIVIGASATAEALRCQLLADGVHLAIAAGHLRGLRRALVTCQHGPVTLCVSLDSITLDRYGETLVRLLDDARHMPGRILSIGVLDQSLPLSMVTHLCCDLYSASASDVHSVLDAVANTKNHKHVSRLIPTRMSRFRGISANGRISECTSVDDITRLLAPRHWQASLNDQCGDPDTSD